MRLASVLFSFACRMSSTSSNSPVIFEATGYLGRKNTLIVADRPLCAPKMSFLVYFGGDIQDLPEKMLAHRDNNRYVKWNLVETATLLSSKFPQHVVVVVRPVQLHLGTFAQYSNFVQSNNFGVPNYGGDFHTVSHLRLLLAAVQRRLENEKSPDEIILVGFSKGCVVLNQLLYDLPDLSAEDQSFVDRISHVVWLDGGHPGGKDTWVTDRGILRQFHQTLAPHCHVHLHLSPYQIADAQRPWIGREEKQFSAELKHLGFQLERKVHFQEDIASLENHFRLLEVFTLTE